MVFHDPGSTYAVLPTTVRPRRIQPGKRTILVSLLLSFMLLMSQLLRALQLDQPPKLTNVHVLQSLSSLNEELVPAPCIKTHLGSERDSKILPNQTCQHLPSSRGLCSLTQNLFFSKKPSNCNHQKRITFCVLKNNLVHCESPAVCADLHHFVGIFSEDSAKIDWKLVSKENLQQKIRQFILQSGSLGFLFIKCSNNSEFGEDLGQPQYDEEYLEQSETQYTQLFLYPPNFEKSEKEKKSSVNINLFMIDSLSRTHFYRSLPKTVKFLEELHESSTAKVLDFQLFQAIKQRTFESLQALFSGYVNVSEVPFGTYDIPRAPLPLSKLFGKFKKNGYRTLWIEDLCWNWEWGLIKDLKVMNESLDDRALWLNFKKALDIANIDSIDITLASCDILAANGKKDPFRDLPVVCYNGRYHHEYILEYLQMYHRSAEESVKPFITYATTSVSHDESGIRVQTLDEPLEEYLRFAAKLDNTLTIVFADHGNSYGKFIESSSEAHAEIFNPLLFMIVPSKVQNYLGDVRMRILKDNEKRLVSLIDLHYMLLEIVQENGDVLNPMFSSQYVVPGGMLSSISPTRTCRDIPLLQPNLCVCKDFETTVKPNSLHSALADFGLGVLNNVILSQHRKDGRSGFGKCTPMKAVELRKVREVHIAVDLILYKLDVVVESVENRTGINRNIFFLTLEAGRNKPGLRLVSYERFDTYSIYQKCCDRGVELKLCICNLEDDNNKSNLLSSLFFGNLLPGMSFLNQRKEFIDEKLIKFIFSPILGSKPFVDFSYPKENPCLYTVIHRYSSGIVLHGLNFCSVIHKLDILVNSKNMFLSCEKHSTFLLRPRDVKTLFGGVQANPKADWHWDHRIGVY